MLARWLRLALALVAILALGGALPGTPSGLGLGAAAAMGAGVLLLVVSAVVAVSYGFALRHAYSAAPDQRATLRRACQAVALEWLATLVLFVVIQPFERWWMGPESRGSRGQAQPPLLLIPGYFCNRGVWWWLRRGLRAQGRSVATIDLEPPLGDIEVLAEGLAARVRSLLAETGADQVALVGHSMGGLVARAYLRRHGDGRVAKLITLGTPHHGTELARIGLGRNARQMEPESAWLRKLAETEPLPVPALSVWSVRDNYVMPQDSSRLAGAREIALPSLGHLSMLFSPKVLEILLEETAAPTSAF
ncbi:MAG: alpha/beta fold hydrolase [Kiloniellales bacterium]|nr:alpha/beta fold hydrolase [Kiloniellales bacterium]